MAEIHDKKGGFAPIKLYIFEKEKKPVNSESDSVEYSAKIIDQRKNGEKVNLCMGWIQNIFSFFSGIFLPYGYPETVSSDYMPYQIWDTIQNLAGWLAKTFATEAVLKALGVGNSNATALAATVTTLLRNGSGWVGEISLAWVRGTAFGYDNKKWRFFANVLANFVLALEMTSPLVPSEFVIYVLCVSSLLNAFTVIADKATRTAIAEHQGLVGNIADVTAKDNSQEKAISILSLGAGLVILPMVSEKLYLGWSMFGAFAVVHIATNYIAIRCLRFYYLNESRLLQCLRQYFRNKTVPSINHVNINESYVLGFGISARDVCGMGIRMGVSIDKGLQIKSGREITAYHVPSLLRKFKDKPFLILPKIKAGYIDVVLQEEISTIDTIEAYFRAASFAYAIKNDKQINKDVHPMDSDIGIQWLKFRDTLKSQNYDLTNFLMKMGENRATWSTVKTE